MVASPPATSIPWAQSPLATFLAGMLVPTIAYYFLLKPTRAEEKSDNTKIDEGDGDWDESDDEVEGNNQNSASWTIMNAPYKMVLCVNTSLGMGKGKIAAQCGHAAVGCYKRSRRQCPKALTAWEHTGCAKIAVKCPTEEEMAEIVEKARNKGIPIYLVEDAGRTQIAAGSRTVLGLGPAPVEVFEGVTSHLKLM